MSLSIPDIVGLFETKGHAQYDGEPVTQLEHALQSAHLAEQEGADSALIAAALLHDLGHLLHDFGGTPTQQGLDDLHQYRCLPFLRALFGSATLEPIRLHVDAKRFLCARVPGYLEALSPDSKRSLQLQGGVFDEAQAKAFETLPYAMDAVRLRQWDDTAKLADVDMPGLAHFVRHLEISSAEHRQALTTA
ncbi:phosphonate degradation associated HDIG domain protein [Variovorax boronicumulans]|uniref:Phosphonate degradation associated HDIG domain protein n=1 Tax=Variovorax boronicumulans TaxID=436515 RepID=A0AAW8E234_9BURK|nr:phosphonate degradation HD-domain oxygenase [Variovorax boronicumulans]MDP9880580.1 phosphonate degradation associated HDIG domain protein [Variovorax boronicumulans]MDP9916940.1 phosphonate degradation associated HDIG domain protein [Variovorax boronicumulans]MDP9925867.1 phosphonate degradation associated HDIG domain protein [Variovorax boronicumulans]